MHEVGHRGKARQVADGNRSFSYVHLMCGVSSYSCMILSLRELLGKDPCTGPLQLGGMPRLGI